MPFKSMLRSARKNQTGRSDPHPAPSASGQPAPSARNLAIGTAASLLGALLILVVAVLPAEYGIDSTGLGQRLGLRSLSTKAAATPDPGANLLGDGANLLADPGSLSDTGPVWKREAPFRADEMSVTLLPNEGAEVKAQMRRGERLVFGWTVDGGKVSFDMHGEPADAPADVFNSYWRGRDQQSANGAFVAPFDGAHGWYWQNRGASPITIQVRTSGYYERLYRPATPTGAARAANDELRGRN